MPTTAADAKKLIALARRLRLNRAALAIELSMGMAPTVATRRVVHTVTDLSERSSTLARKHGFSDAALSEHEELYQEVMFFSSMVPATVSTVDGKLRTSSAASSWRTLQRELLPRLAANCSVASKDELYLMALELWSDEASFAAIRLTGLQAPWSKMLICMESGLLGLSQSRSQLASFLQQLRQVKTYSRRPPLDDGLYRATEAAVQVWCKHQPTPASKTLDSVTTKASPFVRWYFDLMKDGAGLTPSQCQTLLGV